MNLLIGIQTREVPPDAKQIRQMLEEITKLVFLEADPALVATQAAEQLGISTPQSSGRTVRVPGAGWQTVAWFVANADRLGIEQVAYKNQQWTRDPGKWQDQKTTTQAVVATMYDLKKD